MVKDGIKFKDFATCADWELAGGFTTVEGKRVRDEGLLESFDLSLSEAQQLIMNAGELVGWVTKEESEEIIKSSISRANLKKINDLSKNNLSDKNQVTDDQYIKITLTPDHELVPDLYDKLPGKSILVPVKILYRNFSKRKI